MCEFQCMQQLFKNIISVLESEIILPRKAHLQALELQGFSWQD